MTDHGLNVLVIGGGGREHALVWLLGQSTLATRVICAPGNGGILSENRFKNVKEGDFEGILALVRQEAIGFVVVGPEVPLAAGLVDFLKQNGVNAFGPSRAAARLEASKIFTKEVCRSQNIPTAKWAVGVNMASVQETLAAWGTPIVVKADGLCAGKGVRMADTEAEALEVAHDMLVKRTLGDAGALVLLEEKLTGRECSVMAICDGTNAIFLPPARDHKRVGDGDTGPNTGGMGAYAPLPDVGETMLEEIRRTFFLPVLRYMASAGTPFHGVLYAGLMLTKDGPKLLEFNVRFGDPETQAIVPLIDYRKSDLLAYLLAATKPDGLSSFGPIKLNPGAVVCTVLASEGYPKSAKTGRRIVGTGLVRGQLFHAGTDRRNKTLVTSGGRVLGVIGTGLTLEEARRKSLLFAEQVTFQGVHYRKDIGVPPR